MSNFAEGIQQDEAAIQAALSYSWSNGRTEGNVNRLKCIKRLMYGRAKDDLLRKQVFWQGHNPFT
jgi:transposase